MQHLDELKVQADLAMEEGRFDDAERLFQKALEYDDIPTVLNNLAVLQLVHHKRPAEAFRLLRRNLEDPKLVWQPYARALVARCLIRMERPDEARRYVNWAIRDFEAATSAMNHVSSGERLAWQEYTAPILEAVGELGDDRKVWELYQRWTRQHVAPASHLFGGIAAFNRKRFRSDGLESRRKARLALSPGV